jgi:hypothetical protein
MEACCKKSTETSRKRRIIFPLIALLKVYKFAISPFLGQHCRFYPSCSSYAEDALREYGVIKGTVLSVKRILRCNPWCEGGIDLVPKKNAEPTHKNSNS